MHIRRLRTGDRQEARAVFECMATVFEETREPLGKAYLEALLARSDFWALAAYRDGEIAGGLTAHALPLTRLESSELFIYDIAVVEAHRRKGVGRALVKHLRSEAAPSNIQNVFVPADNEDVHALDFYRALGGAPAAVTIFSFDVLPASPEGR